jgi:hypothetical protein
MKTDDIGVLPFGEDSTVNIMVLQDRMWIDNFAKDNAKEVYTWEADQWMARKPYDTDGPACSFRIAVPWRKWVLYRFQDWRDATSFRMTGKRSWWRKK